MNIKRFIRVIWEFPQNTLGFLVKRICKAKPIGTYNDATVYHWNIGGGMSLGKYIFLPFMKMPNSSIGMCYIKHEYGHTLQSKHLGWLYLLVIGLPSLIWARCFGRYRKKTGASYYAFYTESWANKLGEVERSNDEQR